MSEEDRKKEKEEESGEVSRREFLKDAGFVVGGAAVGAAIAWPLVPKETVTETITETITVTEIVEVIKEVPAVGALTSFTVNGQAHELAIAPNRTLAEVLRYQLGLTGTKIGCSMGGCAMCTVLIDGKAILACATLAVEMGGREITTIEGLSNGAELDPLQQAFIDHGAVECGFCTPAAILATKAFLDENPHPTDYEIRVALSSNLCCCHSTPFRIIEAVLAVSK